MLLLLRCCSKRLHVGMVQHCLGDPKSLLLLTSLQCLSDKRLVLGHCSNHSRVNSRDGRINSHGRWSTSCCCRWRSISCRDVEESRHNVLSSVHGRGSNGGCSRNRRLHGIQRDRRDRRRSHGRIRRMSTPYCCGRQIQSLVLG